jgi:RNA polymerase sigma factor (sigma-70 family)
VGPPALGGDGTACRSAGSGRVEGRAPGRLGRRLAQAKEFDQRRGSATSWLLALTVHQARKARRRSVVQQRTLLAEPEHAPSARDLDVEHALDRLSRRQRIAVELYYFLGLPVKEIAAVMSCSEGTVKSTMSDARRRLRTILGEQFYELQ